MMKSRLFDRAWPTLRQAHRLLYELRCVFLPERETAVSHESIPLILYALGATLFLILVWMDRSEQIQNIPAASARH
ncbi:MAG TPA: hypothetical protein DEB15_04995 [Pusillimonas sp.]|nr:hypothetical protein [Pusillimonas sp.]